MKVVISRRYRNNETTGKLVVFDQDNKILELVTIELPDMGNQHNCSCIPEGIYDCEKYSSQEHPDTFHVKNVFHRDGILIHKGNYVAGNKIDSKGCILPGTYFTDLNNDGNIDVAESSIAMGKLINALPALFKLIII